MMQLQKSPQLVLLAGLELDGPSELPCLEERGLAIYILPLTSYALIPVTSKGLAHE